MRPQPGDYGLTPINDAAGTLIRIGQWLNGDGFSTWEHAFVVVPPTFDTPVDAVAVIEAWPGGARRNTYEIADCLFSTGKIAVTPTQRAKIVASARFYLGTPYSFLDYFALAAHRFHLPVPGLRRHIADSGRLLCSQLVDRVYSEAGVKLFRDVWPGYVTPADLAKRLGA